MVARQCVTIRHAAARLTYRQACELAATACRGPGALDVLIDLRQTTETTTGALARLVVLRLELRQHGRDLRITGLRGRARAVYEVNGMRAFLPMASGVWRAEQEAGGVQQSAEA